MKKLMIAAIICANVFVGCKPKQQTTIDKSSGVEVLNIPCDEFLTSTDKAFRAVQSQKSSDLSLSREKALLAAKQTLAGNVETKVKSVTDKYVDEYEAKGGMEMKGKFNSLTRAVVNQQLNDVRVLCQKTIANKDGSYTTFVAIEMSKDAVKESMERSLSDKTKLNIDYDKMKFEQIYNEEMQKLEDAKK